MNGIIIIDKPAGWTSHDVIGKLRSILHEKHIGHSGTLDPMATGVLPVFIGRATRAVEFCESAEKEYTAMLRTGIVTDTQDITGTVLETSDKPVDKNDIISLLPEFTGDIEQIPPMYSAVKIGGQKLYKLARKGIEVERRPRRITIRQISLLGMHGDDFILDIVCSKGTYIRTLCNDIGQRLGCGGAMSYLRRTRAGAFTLDRAVSIADVKSAAESGNMSSVLLPLDSVFSAFPAITIGEKQEKHCRNGNDFSLDTPDGTYRVYGRDGSFLMLGMEKRGIMTTIKSFFEV